MDDFAFAEGFGLDLPDFLESESVGLRLGVSAEVKLLDYLFRETAMATFGEEGDAGVELHPSFKGILWLAVSAYPEIIRSHAFY